MLVEPEQSWMLVRGYVDCPRNSIWRGWQISHGAFSTADAEEDYGLVHFVWTGSVGDENYCP